MCIVFISLTLKGLEVRCPVHRCILWHKILKSPNIRKDKILKSPNFYNVYYGLLYLPYKLQIKNNGRSWIIPTFASNKAPWADCSYWCFNSLSPHLSTTPFIPNWNKLSLDITSNWFSLNSGNWFSLNSGLPP